MDPVCPDFLDDESTPSPASPHFITRGSMVSMSRKNVSEMRFHFHFSTNHRFGGHSKTSWQLICHRTILSQTLASTLSSLTVLARATAGAQCESCDDGPSCQLGTFHRGRCKAVICPDLNIEVACVHRALACIHAKGRQTKHTCHTCKWSRSFGRHRGRNTARCGACRECVHNWHLLCPIRVNVSSSVQDQRLAQIRSPDVHRQCGTTHRLLKRPARNRIS